ncbi:YIP1 family protein [Staphylococcus pettenkoferi]|uniref:YIP1 family protein n=1 Tax=Staphylococcus pettenkoferi TaxID=170573 RepID=UPI00119F2B44|nr:YIP1 family protein [Staphylococcus pettenkoferi]MCY1591261.1 YIP1 family protein [Staphylococcus pettenkoferi]MCY1593438.1 YIP1 family protein [Staphylococcus pettenkoferi]MCY1599885.1 YIP1 family protein [Staphylococcus pettenkoferi]MCY1601196.1 YIP1 family protein [Staphylococcus pettenkoferi]MCY1609555.1 YIP1 family protein [Staphylococcus pettenkoferi]
MKNSNIPFADYFYYLRENPKWLLKLIIFIVLSVLLAIVTIMGTDLDKALQQSNLHGQQLANAKKISMIGAMISGLFSSFIQLLILFVIILVISKIANKDIKGKSLFSATLSFMVITLLIGLVVAAIQLIFGLPIKDYTITSLNIFDKGNKILGAFNLQTLIAAYFFGLIFYSTSKFSGKTSLILGVLYLIVNIGFALLGASVS